MMQVPATGSSGEALLRYEQTEFFVLKPGRYVRCAATGVEIPLNALKYWNVDRQEPYADPHAVTLRRSQLGDAT